MLSIPTKTAKPRMFAETLLGIWSFLLALPQTVLDYIKKWLHYWRLASRFPGPRAWPLVGNILTFGYPPTGGRFFFLMLRALQKYPQGRVWLGPFRLLWLNNPEDIQCYTQNIKNQNKPALTYDVISDVLGDGLATRSGERWRAHHGVIAPTFHPDILNNYVSVFDKKTDIYIARLQKYADGSSHDLKQTTKRLSIDITLETLFGVPADNQTKQDEALEPVDFLHSTVEQRLMRPWFYPSFIYNRSSQGREVKRCMALAYAFLYRVMEERKKILLEEEAQKSTSSEVPYGRKQRRSTLDAMLLEMRKGKMSPKEVVEEMMTLFLGAFDTSYLTVLFTLICLAKNPHIQDKVLQELEEIFGDSENPEVNLDTLQQLEYLEMVVKETLRLYPPIWLFVRVTGVDTPLPTSDRVVPAGAHVLMSPKSLHSDPRVHPRPEVFDPERFSPENAAEMHPFAFIPFSAGPRACVGRRYSMMQVKAILAKVLWHYKIFPDPSYKPTFVWGVSAVPKNGIWMKMVRRRQ